MPSKRAASSTPTLTHATPRHLPGSASSENIHFQTGTRDRPRRASGTPTSLPRRDSDSQSTRPTRARVGPLPKNGPGNPLFPPLPPKVASKPRRESQMSQLERMDGASKTDKGKDQEESELAPDSEPEDWEWYTQKQRKVRGFAGGVGDVEPLIPKEEEQQPKEEDHETMTSGLSENEAEPENEAGNESGEGGEVGDDAEVQSTTTVKAEPEKPSTEPSEPKLQPEDAESQTSSDKRSLRNRNPTERSTHSNGRARDQDEAIDDDMDSRPEAQSNAVQAGREDDELAADDLPDISVFQGQVDANGDVTRCVCGREADIDAMMIQCDLCNVWQHGACVGIWGDEEAPDEYFCELCKPALHAPLKRFLRIKQKQGQGFVVPTPHDLKQYLFTSDRIKPSQSKRWTDPSVIKDESMSPPPRAVVPLLPPPNYKSSSGTHAPSSRSHKAKAHSPVIDTRRSAGPVNRAHSSTSDKPHQEFKVPAGSSTRPGGGTSTRRFSNTSSSESPLSPNGGIAAGGGGKGKDVPLGPVKKRSTMNSRDAAYEEAIAASLREAAGGGLGAADDLAAAGTRSRRGATESQEYGQEDDEGGKKGKKPTSSSASAVTPSAASRGVKRSRQEEEDVEEAGEDAYIAISGRKGKKKKEELDAMNKPKHPNQYTYRPKNGTSGSSTATPTQATIVVPEKARAAPQSPSKKQTSSAGPGSNAASRRLGGGGTRGGTPSSVAGSVGGQGSGSGAAGSSNSLSWNLPDHLAPFAYTLPANPPSMLEIITPRPPQTGKHKGGDPALRDPSNGETTTHFEAPTKIRYPTKRMTLGEMRKRVRNLLEFVGRVQGEEDKRGERARLLELIPRPTSMVASEETAAGQAADGPSDDTETREDGSTKPTDVQAMDVDVPANGPSEDGQMQKGDANVSKTSNDADGPPTPMNVDEAPVTAPDVAADVNDKPTTNGESVASSSEENAKPQENPRLENVPSTEESVSVEETGITEATKSAEPTPINSVEAAPAPLSESTTTVPPPTAPPPSEPPTDGAGPTREAPPAEPQQPSKSSQLLAELTSDLIRFQMMFEVGGSVFAAPASGSAVVGGGEDD